MGRAFSRTLFYKDTGDSNRIKLLTGQTNVKLQPAAFSYPTGAIALTETTPGTSGVYKNDDVNDNIYKIYINDIYREEFGIFFVADDDIAIYAKLAGGNAFTGAQTMDSTLSVGTDLTVGDDLMVIDNLTVGNDAVITDQCTMGRPYIEPTSSWYNNGDPGVNNGLVWKSWVVAQIAAISLSPYQESTNFRRCIPNGSTETNKVYTTPKAAALSFASPGINNQCNVFIPGTGSSSRYITAMPGSQIDYVNFTGAGRHINLILTDGAANVKITKFENLTIFLGANDYATARTMSNKTFINCTIYAYKDTTYTDCILINCRFIHASTFKVFIAGATMVENCYCNNEYDKSGLTTGYVAGFFGIDVTTLPTDPSTGIPSEE